MTTLLIVLHILVSLFLIVIVLLQHGKGADIGATFGGSSQSVFGSEGPVPLLNKITTFSAIVFMGTSISLAYISANKSTGSIMTELPAQETVPVAQEAPITIPMPGTEVQLNQPAQDAAQEPIAEEIPLDETIQEALVEEDPIAEVQETAPVVETEEQTAEQAAPVKQE
ncbi:MAG: preprotein translocase subunit SecG [Candidatus Electrothrix sp. MAN1_4]|nr:preprotein translocase subunit SecG [Candidatus Electrothrix sp. MAN1_4]